MPDSIIKTIEQRCDPKTGLVQLEPVTVEVGDKVRVFDGPLAGIEGVFRERKGETGAVVVRKLLGAGTIVEVESLLLQKAM